MSRPERCVFHTVGRPNCNIDTSLHHILILPCVDRARRGIDIGVRGMCAVCAQKREGRENRSRARARARAHQQRSRARCCVERREGTLFPLAYEWRSSGSSVGGTKSGRTKSGGGREDDRVRTR